MQQQSVFTSLLETILTTSGADGAYLYRFETEGKTAHLTAWAGAPPKPAFNVLKGRFAREHFERESPLILHEDAASDPRFLTFPEFSAQHFAGVASIPLTHDGARTGLLNVCRLGSPAFVAGESNLLFGLTLPFGALLAATAENEKLSRQLADRKLIERAKGLLQSRLGWSEEEAYIHLQRTSRQRRTPLREIATEIIDRPNRHFLEARLAS